MNTLFKGKSGNYVFDKGARKTRKKIKDLSKKIQNNPNDFSTLRERAIEYYRCRDFDNAFEDLNLVIKHDHDDAVAFNLRGLIYHFRNDHETAIKDFSRAIDLKPNNPYYTLNRSLAYLELKDLQKSQDDINTAIAIDPNFALSYYCLAGLKKAMGDDEAADEAYEKAVDLGINDFFEVIGQLK